MTTVVRGGVELRGVEVDHLWLAVAPRGEGAAPPWVLDVAFPLLAPAFVAALREYVADDAERDELDRVAVGLGLQARVIGLYPATVRYRGAPTWARAQQGA